ncbi:MAG TPA: hypothetical protein VFZ93_03755, partial [Albitalea sp.]
MTPADIDRVFGRGRLKMVTGEHVEVFREEALPGERRRYTKRFLCTSEGDFRQWTEREWRILARLVGHGIGPVPDVVQFDRGANGRPALVQTYDAGVTVDHWMTLLPVQRDGRVLRHVFEDCAHWWALARHCLIALDAIHELRLVHLDLKADNVCIPVAPADFDAAVPGMVLQPLFEQIALIDFAFSLVSGERLATALPIGHQTDYDYQSPRLLRALDAGRHGDLMPTRQLDWRCDIFSLAAMLRRCLPPREQGGAGAWTSRRYACAEALVDRLFDVHYGPATEPRPHRELIELASVALRDAGLLASLQRGWCLASDTIRASGETPTPITRIAMPVTVPAVRPAGPSVPAEAPALRSAGPAVAALRSAGPAAADSPAAPIALPRATAASRALAPPRVAEPVGPAARPARSVGRAVWVSAVLAGAAALPFLDWTEAFPDLAGSASSEAAFPLAHAAPATGAAGTAEAPGSPEAGPAVAPHPTVDALPPAGVVADAGPAPVRETTPPSGRGALSTAAAGATPAAPARTSAGGTSAMAAPAA